MVEKSASDPNLKSDKKGMGSSKSSPALLLTPDFFIGKEKAGRPVFSKSQRFGTNGLADEVPGPVYNPEIPRPSTGVKIPKDKRFRPAHSMQTPSSQYAPETFSAVGNGRPDQPKGFHFGKSARMGPVSKEKGPSTELSADLGQGMTSVKLPLGKFSKAGRFVPLAKGAEADTNTSIYLPTTFEGNFDGKPNANKTLAFSKSQRFLISSKPVDDVPGPQYNVGDTTRDMRGVKLGKDSRFHVTSEALAKPGCTFAPESFSDTGNGKMNTNKAVRWGPAPAKDKKQVPTLGPDYLGTPSPIKGSGAAMSKAGRFVTMHVDEYNY